MILTQETPPHRARILIVEDEGIVAWDIEQNLKDLGFDVTGIAASSDEALKTTAATSPDLVLMDVRIQGPDDGIATAERIRERYGVPVIYLTAHGDRDTVQRAKRTEPLGYLLKPFKKEELNSAVEVALYRHDMERKLRERERLLAITLGSIGDAVITTDTDGRITFMNRVAERLTGWTQDAALGCTFAEVVRLRNEHTGEDLQVPIRRAIRERKTSTMPLGRLLARDGEEYLIADSAAPVADGQTVHGAVVVFQDVTQQRRMQQQLELSDRMASMGTMAAGVAHEVNNPLTFIVVNLDFAIHELSDCWTELQALGGTGAATARRLEEVHRALNEASGGARRIGEIVTDFRSFARPGPDRTCALDVREPLTWSIDATEHAWRQRATLVRLLGDVPRVEGDHTRLTQVFLNLLLNACHAIPPGAARQNAITVTTETDANGWARVEIRDTGCGMEADVRKRIFEPFFTTKPVGSGTGLGLSVCHGIITGLGGRLEVDSEPGAGSTFRITLPPAPAHTSTAPRPQGPSSSLAPRSAGRILIVDDEPWVLRALDRMLSGRHDVTCVTSADDALQLLGTGEAFDVVLCDLMMPDQTGMAFHAKLRERHPELVNRVVFLTGGGLAALGEAFLDSVPNQRLQKPVDPETLRDLIAELLETQTP